jgi:hypothetical protein
VKKPSRNTAEWIVIRFGVEGRASEQDPRSYSLYMQLRFLAGFDTFRRSRIRKWGYTVFVNLAGTERQLVITMAVWLLDISQS